MRIELLHLAVGSPKKIAGPRVSEMGVGTGLEATGGIEAGGQFIGERLVVHQAVVVGRADRLFVETLGVELAAFEAGDLGAGQRGAACEVLRAVPGPLS